VRSLNKAAIIKMKKTFNFGGLGGADDDDLDGALDKGIN